MPIHIIIKLKKIKKRKRTLKQPDRMNGLIIKEWQFSSQQQ